MTASRHAGPPGPAHVHVRISTLIVERAAVGNADGRGLRESVARRIADRLERPSAEPDSSAGRLDLSDTIASAVADHVSSRLDLARRG